MSTRKRGAGLFEPLSSVIAAIDLAADEIAQEIHGSITSSHSDGLERKTRVARSLLELRKGAQSLVGELSAASAVGGGESANDKKGAAPIEASFEEFCQLEIVSDEVITFGRPARAASDSKAFTPPSVTAPPKSNRIAI